MKIAIIGAGIGGLTSGILLVQEGVSVQIFEQANEMKSVGAGIILAHNATQVYMKCGLYSKILSRGNPVNSLNISNKKLAPYSRAETGVFDKKYSVKSIAIHRAELQKILFDRFMENQKIKLGKKLIRLENSHSCRLYFNDGTNEHFDAVIAADGIHSVVRNTLFPKSRIRDTKQKCWRGVAKLKLPVSFQNVLYEAWGVGDRFGFVQISPDQVYWYALHNVTSKYADKTFVDIFKDYHPLIHEIISETNESEIYESEIHDLKPISKWVEGKVCLLGDAAHATTPNLGQGACQAIEDAYVVNLCLKKYPLDQAFLKYEKIRHKKAKVVVDLSWRFGKLSQLQNPFAAGVRNSLIRLIPSNINAFLFDKIYRLSNVV